MKNTTKFLLFTLVLLLVGLGTISAAEDVSDTSQTDDIATDITESNVIKDTTTKDSVLSANQKTIEKSDMQNGNKTVKQAYVMSVTSNSYDEFFKFDEEEEVLKTTELVNEGDTLNLIGTFDGLDFVVDKPITLTSLNNNTRLINSTVHVLTSGSGSTISNLFINNSDEYTPGILVNDAENLTVEYNYVEVSGLHSYAFEANINHSVIRENYFETHRLTPDTERTHTALVLSAPFDIDIITDKLKKVNTHFSYF